MRKKVQSKCLSLLFAVLINSNCIGMEVEDVPVTVMGIELQLNDYLLNIFDPLQISEFEKKPIKDSSFEAFFKSTNVAQEEDPRELLPILELLNNEGLIGTLRSFYPQKMVTIAPQEMTMEKLIEAIDNDRPLRNNKYDKYIINHYHQNIGSKLDVFQWQEVIKNTHIKSSFCLLCANDTIQQKIAVERRYKSSSDRSANLMLKCVARHDLCFVLKSYAYDMTCQICNNKTFNNAFTAFKHVLFVHALKIISHQVPEGFCLIEGYKKRIQEEHQKHE